MTPSISTGKKNWRLITLGVVLGMIVLAVLTGFFCRGQANEKMTSLVSQYSQGQCEKVGQLGNELTGLMRLGLDAPQQKRLGEILAECGVVSQARKLAGQKDNAGAYTAYTQYIKEYPRSSIYPIVEAEAQDSYLAFADEKSAGAHYQDALTVYKEFLKSFPKSAQLTRAITGYLDAYKHWVDALYGQQEYEQALAISKTWVMQEIPETDAFYKEMAPKILWDWGQLLESEKKFDEALEKYQTITADFPESQIASEAKSRIPGVYYAWGVDLYSKNLKTEAVQKFLEALKLVSTADQVYKDIWDNYPEAFIAYARWLREQGKLVEAVALLDQLLKADINDEITAEATAEFGQAVEALAGDDGTEGQRLIAQAKKAFCAKKSTAFYSPAIDYYLQNPGRALFCSGGDGYYPSSLSATTPGELRYYVKFSAQEFAVEKCDYTGGYTLTRTQYSLLVEIRYARNMKYYVSRLFYGSTPPVCPSYYGFYSKNEKLYGGAVGKQTVIDWLLLVIV